MSSEERHKEYIKSMNISNLVNTPKNSKSTFKATKSNTASATPYRKMVRFSSSVSSELGIKVESDIKT